MTPKPSDSMSQTPREERLAQALRELRELIEQSVDRFTSGSPYILTYSDIIERIKEVEALRESVPPAASAGDSELLEELNQQLKVIKELRREMKAAGEHIGNLDDEIRELKLQPVAGPSELAQRAGKPTEDVKQNVALALQQAHDSAFDAYTTALVDCGDYKQAFKLSMQAILETSPDTHSLELALLEARREEARWWSTLGDNYGQDEIEDVERRRLAELDRAISKSGVCQRRAR